MGPVFNDSAIAKEVNFSYVPLPDSVSDSRNGDLCAYGDQVEACALDVTGCLNGCSGDALTKLSSFVTCFEKSWVEMMCDGAKTKASTCAESSGIDSDKLTQCLSTDSKVKQLEEELSNMDPGNLRVYPTVKIGTSTKNQGDSSQDPTDLKKALCSQGVTAAC